MSRAVCLVLLLVIPTLTLAADAPGDADSAPIARPLPPIDAPRDGGADQPLDDAALDAPAPPPPPIDLDYRAPSTPSP